MRALLLAIALVLHACSNEEQERASRIVALREAVDSFDGELAETEADVRALSSTWNEIADAYQEVSSRYRDARRAYASTRTRSNDASALARESAINFEKAATSWRIYREVIKLAIAIDRARAASASDRRWSTSCEHVSTASYRRMLLAQGIDLLGKDIDHIVPRALGGADHPANYQVLDASLNRSLGKTWNIEKCAMAGDRRCAEAVAISAKCGRYRGGF